MKMPETITQDYLTEHLCGFPVRLHLELTNVQVKQVKLSEAQVSYSGKVAYYSPLDMGCISHCPGCGKELPKVGEAQ
jgi:hypothetical protein